MKNTPLYIAVRYLLAKKGSTAVTFITWLAALAMMVAVASMFIIISVFSGLEDLNKDLISNLHADLTISSKVGKTISNIPQTISVLKKNTEIKTFSKIIEEKVYIQFRAAGEIAYLRGVDSAYVSVNPMDKNIYYGTYPSFKFSNEVIMENSLNNRLSLPVNSNDETATLLMPKAGKGIISKEEDIFNKKNIYVTGVFPGNDQLENYIIAPIELSQELLNLQKNTAYQIVVKLKNPEDADQVKDQLSQSLGKDLIIKTKKEENAAFWKMINTEKLMIYLIFGLVIFITTFNLAGAIIIIQLDKKEQAKSLISLGFSLKQLRNTYFYTGLLIVFFGIVFGLISGSILGFFQLKTKFFQAAENLAFPIKLVLSNYVIVAIITSLFGITVSWFFSKINKQNFINS